MSQVICEGFNGARLRHSRDLATSGCFRDSIALWQTVVNGMPSYGHKAADM